MADDFILCAYDFEESGKGIPLSDDQIAANIKNEELSWVHLDAADPRTRTWLKDNIDFIDSFSVDALLEAETNPRIIESPDGMLIIMRGVNMHEGAEPEDMISIRLWIDEHRIISTQRRHLMAIDDLIEALQNGNGPRCASDFLIMLISNLSRRMELVISDLDERTDDIEEAVLDDPDLEERHQIVDIRKKAIVLRRYFMPQRDVLTYLRNSSVSWLDADHKRELQENYDRMTRYIETLDMIRERSQIVKDELSNIMADRMNRNMYVLSIVAAIFLPLGFLTGLLGINVGGMPGANDPMAFWVVCALCAFFAALFIGVFRFMKLL